MKPFDRSIRPVEIGAGQHFAQRHLGAARVRDAAIAFQPRHRRDMNLMIGKTFGQCRDEAGLRFRRVLAHRRRHIDVDPQFLRNPHDFVQIVRRDP